MLNTYLDIGKNGCQIISNFEDKKGAILISVVGETTQKISMPTMLVTQNQLFENPNSIKEISDNLWDALLAKHEQNINLEAEDIESFINYGGLIYLKSAKSIGDDCAVKAVLSLVDSLSLNKIATSLLFFQIHPDFPIMNISDAIDVIHEKTSTETPVFLSLIMNESLLTEEVRVSMMFSNFK